MRVVSPHKEKRGNLVDTSCRALEELGTVRKSSWSVPPSRVSVHSYLLEGGRDHAPKRCG